MQRTVKVNFPNDFNFPEMVDEEGQIKGKNMYDTCFYCPFLFGDTYEGIYHCLAYGGEKTIYKCPFYGTTEKDVIEI